MKMNGLLRKILVMGIVALFLGVIGLAFFKVNIVAYASGAIYIRADGSVEGTAFIQSSDNVTYVFTADVNDCDYMYVQRSNIIVDGNGHLLNSSGAPEDGVSVMFVNNVTIKNVSVQGFGFGIYLYDAANNTISGNNLTNNYAGIGINSCGNNTVSGNTVTGNIAYGIYLYSSSNYNSIFGNNIIGNNITNNEDGVYLESSSGNTVSGNNITNCSYGIYLVMQNIANDVTDLSVTIGDIVLNNNTISSNSNGIFVDVHDVGVDMYGNSSVAIGDLRIANNVINSSGKGINVNGFYNIGVYMLNNTAFSIGNIEITGNTVNSTQQGIYLHQITDLGEEMYDNSSFTMGSILVNDNTVNSDDYGIAPWFIRNFGNGLVDNSSFAMGNIEFCKNTINSTKDAIGFSQFTGFGTDIYGNASFSMGNVLVNDNILYSDIWLTDFGYFGSGLYENSSCTMGNVEFCGNEIYLNWVGGITFYGLGSFGYEMYNYSLFKMGDFSVNDNIIQCNSTRAGISCTQSGGFGISVYDNAVAMTGTFEFDGNDISSGWVGLSLYSLKDAMVRNNTIWNCAYGIYLQDSVSNTIYSNSFYENVYSIYLQSSSGNSILGNNITSSSNPGIYLYGSSSNVISGNTVKDSPNEHIELLYSSNNNIISGNTLTNSTADVGIYVYQCSLNSFFENNITGNALSGIVFEVAWDSTISENNISKNLNGIYLYYSSNITISKNDITTNNESGIVIDLSDNNTVNGNNIMTNKEYGVDFNSASNKFFHNNFINNTVQVRAPNYNNTWDNGYPSGGNYWSDYLTRYPNATEIDHTGIGDTAYEINANNTDHYPFMIPYETIPPTIIITSPENKTYAVNASIPLTFTVDEMTTWIGYSLNGQANVTISGNTTLPTLPDGRHYVAVYANDTFGNMGFATVYFTVDTTKPNITNVVQDPLTDILPDTVVKVNATVTDATSGIKQVLLNCTFTNSTDTWYAVFSMTHLTGDVWNATIMPCPYGTNVTYVIIAEDNAGNTITTEQIYGYKYEYPVVPEFTLLTVLIALFIATSLIAIIAGKKKALPKRNKTSPNFPFSAP